MKTTITSLIAVAAVFAVASAQAISLDFDGSGTTSKVVISGGTISFAPANNNILFDNGDLGTLSGTATILAPVTVVGDVMTANLATVGGQLTVDDGQGGTFTADLSWLTIGTLKTFGGLNVDGAINLSNIQYDGTQADWNKFEDAGEAVMTVSFQTTGRIDLVGLQKGTKSLNTSFSGTMLTVPDGGLTLALLGSVLVGVETLRRRITR